MEKYSHRRHLSNAIYGDVQLYQNDITKDTVVIKRMSRSHMARRISYSDQIPVQEDGYSEIMIMKQLPYHPNVLGILDSFEENGFEHLVSEFCSQGDLFDYIQLQTELETPCAQKYFGEIVCAIQFLHTHQVAHRDISLENVLLDQQLSCKVSDFGLATKDVKWCQGGHVGKVFYMSPELFAGLEYNPFQADIWSLGVLLFVLLTGCPLYEEPSDADPRFVLLRTHGIRALLDQWNKQLSFEIVEVLDACLKVNPTKRCTIQRLIQMNFVKHAARKSRNSGSSARARNSACIETQLSFCEMGNSRELVESRRKNVCVSCNAKFHIFRHARSCDRCCQKFCKSCIVVAPRSRNGNKRFCCAECA